MITVQELIDNAQTLLPSTQVHVVGVSGESYLIEEIVAGDVLTLRVQDKVSDDELDDETSDDEE